MDYLYDDHDDFYGSDWDDVIEDNSAEDSDAWDDSYNDSMDGDAESAFGSCGWGNDETYGYYGEDY